MTQSYTSESKQEISDQTTIKSQALRTARILLVAALGLVIFYVFLAWQLAAWQMYTLTAIIAAFVGTTAVSMRLMRDDRINTGVWIIIISMMVVFPTAALLIDGVGLVFGITLPILTFTVASQALTREQNWRATGIAIGIGVLTIAIQYFPLEYRLFVPIIQTIVPIMTALIVLTVGFFAARNAWSGNLGSRLTTSYILVAAIPLILVTTIVSFQSFRALETQALDAEAQIAKRVAEQAERFIRDRENELLALNSFGYLDNLSPQELRSVLLGLLSSENLYNEIILTDGTGRELIYLSAASTITEADLGNRAGSVDYEEPKATGETYFGPVEFNPLTGEPFMVIALPIFDLRSGELQNVLIANFRFKSVWDLMAQADTAGSGIVYMIDLNNNVVAHQNPSVVLQGTQVDLPSENSYTTGLRGETVAMAREHIVLNQQEFDIVAERPQSEAVALAISNVWTSIIVALLMVGVATGAGLFISRLITTPLAGLADAAGKLAGGDLGVRAKVEREDEIGSLATSFNEMAGQLQDTLEGLEERVAARTKDLATVANVSTVTATIRDPQEMLANMVHLTQRGFGLYHAHVFTFDAEQDMLSIVACGYREGDEHEGTHGTTTIALGREQSLVALCARTRRPVIVNDVRNEPGWLPNPLLPETRSELAVPMIVGDELLGVLDVQSEYLDAFTEEDANIQMTLASQIATALQNARTYAETQKRAEIESLVNVIGQRIQRSTSMEETLQIAIRELGMAIGAKRVKARLQPATGAPESTPATSVEAALVATVEDSAELAQAGEDTGTVEQSGVSK